jgi:hypothetical protein
LIPHESSSPREATHDFGPRLDLLLQKYPFASARVIANHFLMAVLTIKEILQRQLWMKTLSRSWVPYFEVPVKKMLVLKHERRCYDFCKNPKKIILMESQRAMSRGLDISICALKCLLDHQQMLFR